MPRRVADDEDWDDDDAADWDGDDDDDAVEGDADDDDETVPCPYCRRDIHEDAPRCPYCERYLSREDAPPSPKPWWLILGALLGLYACYRWVAGGW